MTALIYKLIQDASKKLKTAVTGAVFYLKETSFEREIISLASTLYVNQRIRNATKLVKLLR